MPEKYIDRLCRICMNESYSYSPIYEEIYPDNIMLFEVMNDVCQLEVTVGDELPEHICSDCCFKLSEFRKFKMRSHEVRASLQRLKENILNLYLEIPSESSLIENWESIEVKVEPEDSCEYDSGRMESSKEYIGIKRNDQVSCLPIHVPEESITDYEEAVTNENESMSIHTEAKGEKLLGKWKLDLNMDGLEANNNPFEGTSENVRGSSLRADNNRVNLNNDDELSVENRINKFGAHKWNLRNRNVSVKHVKCHCPEENVSIGRRDDGNADSQRDTPRIDNKRKTRNHSSFRNVSKEARLGRKVVVKPVQLCKNLRSTNSCNDKQQGQLNRYFCDVCGKGFVRKVHLGRHARDHAGIKPFQCAICGKSFTCKGYLKRHIMSHRNEGRYVCCKCGKSFKEVSHLTDHIITHSKEVACGCEVCNKTFTRETHLNRHNTVHNDDKPFFCHICGMAFKHEIKLKYHLVKHNDTMPFRCDICGTGFSLKSVLKDHRLRHSKGLFFCPICNKSFKTKGDLAVHTSIHNGVRRYYCSLCKNMYTTAYKLKEHMHAHSTEKPFLCPNCGIRFTFLSTFEQHLKLFCKGK